MMKVLQLLAFLTNSAQISTVVSYLWRFRNSHLIDEVAVSLLSFSTFISLAKNHYRYFYLRKRSLEKLGRTLSICNRGGLTGNKSHRCGQSREFFGHLLAQRCY